MSDAWICGNDKNTWHLGRMRELRSARTGNVTAGFYVASCNGHPLGGAWGFTKREDAPNPAICCKRCLAIAHECQRHGAA